jgi:hypothetical protein
MHTLKIESVLKFISISHSLGYIAGEMCLPEGFKRRFWLGPVAKHHQEAGHEPAKAKGKAFSIC